MPTGNEVFAALDVLWNAKTIRAGYELRADNTNWQDSALPKIARFIGKFPTLKAPSKRDFEVDFFEVVEEALAQAERIRRSEDLEAIYPVNACSVVLAPGKYAVELFIKRNGGPELIDGFDSISAANAWIREKANAYVVQKGAPGGTTVIRVGERY